MRLTADNPTGAPQTKRGEGPPFPRVKPEETENKGGRVKKELEEAAAGPPPTKQQHEQQQQQQHKQQKKKQQNQQQQHQRNQQEEQQSKQRQKQHKQQQEQHHKQQQQQQQHHKQQRQQQKQQQDQSPTPSVPKASRNHKLPPRLGLLHASPFKGSPMGSISKERVGASGGAPTRGGGPPLSSVSNRSKRYATLLEVKNPMEVEGEEEFFSDDEEERNRSGAVPLWWV
ncbi:hypothetical protein ACSSS7_000527 [Eimeria intestinalis]